jgi:hypothetical protein
MADDIQVKLQQQKYWSGILKNMKDFMSSLVDDLVKRELKVVVSNDNGKLLKETAENTRKANAKLGKLFTASALQGLARTSTIPVGIKPTKLPAITLRNRQIVQIYNDSASIIYVGGADVTVETGIPVFQNKLSQQYPVGSTLELYAIAEKEGQNVRVIELSQYVEA